MQEIKEHIKQFEDKSCPKDLISDFQNGALQTLHERYDVCSNP